MLSFTRSGVVTKGSEWRVSAPSSAGEPPAQVGSGAPPGVIRLRKAPAWRSKRSRVLAVSHQMSSTKHPISSSIVDAACRSEKSPPRSQIVFAQRSIQVWPISQPCVDLDQQCCRCSFRGREGLHFSLRPRSGTLGDATRATSAATVSKTLRRRALVRRSACSDYIYGGTSLGANLRIDLGFAPARKLLMQVFGASQKVEVRAVRARTL